MWAVAFNFMGRETPVVEDSEGGHGLIGIGRRGQHRDGRRGPLDIEGVWVDRRSMCRSGRQPQVAWRIKWSESMWTADIQALWKPTSRL